jgi:hypothetical protein
MDQCKGVVANPDIAADKTGWRRWIVRASLPVRGRFFSTIKENHAL